MPFQRKEGEWVDSYGIRVRRKLPGMPIGGHLDPIIEPICREEEKMGLSYPDSRDRRWEWMLNNSASFRIPRKGRKLR